MGLAPGAAPGRGLPAGRRVRQPPIVVISANRPDYLREVLASLAAQQGVGIAGREVLLFQDGARHPRSGRLAAGPAAIAAGRAALLHAEIGPVGAWGAPRDEALRHLWPNCLCAMWAEWSRRRTSPDLVPVDGRFRVAAALSVLLATGGARGAAPTVLMLDLSAERANERVVFEAYDVAERAGRLCVLRPRADAPPAKLAALFLARLFEP
jgi:hypothetical protein